MDYDREEAKTICSLKNAINRLQFMMAKSRKDGLYANESFYKDKIYELESIIKELEDKDV